MGCGDLLGGTVSTNPLIVIGDRLAGSEASKTDQHPLFVRTRRKQTNEIAAAIRNVNSKKADEP